MYYDNKFGFYLRQYGTQIIVGIICLIILCSGVFLYFRIHGTQSSNVASNSEQTQDESILPDELKNLQPGQKVNVKIAKVADGGVLTLIYGNQRIQAKMIGIDFSDSLPDTLYQIGNDLEGKNLDVSFDSAKVQNGYAMIYVYTDDSTLYNAKLLEDGRLILDSSIDKKDINYQDLAESQAYAKQNLTGVWGE